MCYFLIISDIFCLFVQMLLDALAVATQRSVNDLYDSIHLLHNSINHWYIPSSNNPGSSNESKTNSTGGTGSTSTSSSSTSSTLNSFYHLCHSFGIVDERDTPLILTLLTTFEQHYANNNIPAPEMSKDLQLLQYLPVYASGLFVLSEFYEMKSSHHAHNSFDYSAIQQEFSASQVNYHLYYHIYANNFHVIPFALNKMFLFIFTLFQMKKWSFDVKIQSIYDQKKTPATPANAPQPVIYQQHFFVPKEFANNMPMLTKYYQSLYISFVQENYLKISSQILLLLSNQAINQLQLASTSSIYSLGGVGGGSASNPSNTAHIQLNYPQIPFHSLYGLLLMLMEFSPGFLSHNFDILEECLPYDIIYNGFYDISLGKYNFHENLPKLAK
jgi:hypothetical protein